MSLHRQPAGVQRDILLVSSTFPPVVGGSAVVYEQLCRNAPESTMGLGPSRNYKRGEPYSNLSERDAASPYIMYRLDYLRPISADKRRSLPVRLLSVLVDDLPVMAPTFASVGALTRRHRVKVVCVGELVDLGWLVLPVRYLLGLKVVIYTHGEEIFQTRNRLLGVLRGFFLRHAHAIISVSHCCKNGIISRYGIPPSKIFVISNGVDLERFKRSRGNRTIIPPYIRDRKLVLSVSRLVERKGLEFLIRAVPLVIRDVPDAHFIIIGTGP